MIKLKIGLCPECIDKSEKPIISGKCQFHYWNSKRKPLKPPTKPIKPRSKKRERQESKYRSERKKYLDANPICELHGCNSKEVTLHHMAGRVGNLIHDKRYFKALCWPHHQWVELHPNEAKSLGLSTTRLDK